MSHPSYAEGNSPVQQNITGAKKHKFDKETTQKQNIFLFSKKYDAFFLDRGDAQICKFAHALCKCENSSQGGVMGFCPKWSAPKKGPPSSRIRGDPPHVGPLIRIVGSC